MVDQKEFYSSLQLFRAVALGSPETRSFIYLKQTGEYLKQNRVADSGEAASLVAGDGTLAIAKLSKNGSGSFGRWQTKRLSEVVSFSLPDKMMLCRKFASFFPCTIRIVTKKSPHQAR